MCGVVVIGAHRSHNPSMHRYTDLLARSYEALGYQVKIVRPPAALSRRAPRRLRKWVGYVEKYLLFPLRLQRLDRDAIIHVADHSDAPYITFLRSRDRTIVTCHDLIAVRAAVGELPEHQTRGTGRALQKWILSSLSRAGTIISVSQSTASDLVRLVGRPGDAVLPNPLDDRFLEHSVTPGDPNQALIVSTVGWRKRRDLAVRAWCELNQRSPRSLDLVVIGPSLTAEERGIILAAGYATSQVRTVQDVSDERLLQEYRSSRLLIQTSKYEGFCWPILEANSQGVVALCADEPILRETGAGNVFFDPTATDTDFNAVMKAADDQTLASRLQERARMFSEERFREALSNIIRNA
ncbi:glycosyltransferase [Curtobacterium flaccumfaciens]|uniref:glycosyltransferase n=1 Tax=Curtobacterium flaccumfaciens TaxID=2035 RepID=UPI0038795133